MKESISLINNFDKIDYIGGVDVKYEIGTYKAVVRTRANVAPLYVSSGHKISLATAIDFVLKCTTKFRIPEPLREAHRRGRTFNPG